MFAWLLYVFAVVNFVQVYVVSTKHYLTPSLYYHGLERMPYQSRVLPIPFLMALDNLAARVPFLHSGSGVLTTTLFAPFAFSLASYGVALYFTIKLFRCAIGNKQHDLLVGVVFLCLMAQTFVLRPINAAYYSYDFAAAAFFAAGMYAIYLRRFALLALVTAVGSFNRETTLFLVALYAIDQYSSCNDWRAAAKHLVPGCAVLFALWLAIRLPLNHMFAGNDHSDAYNRLTENLHAFLHPNSLPSLFNIGGFVLPILFLLRRSMPPRLRSWLWVVPLWVGVMFVWGMLPESRIYGELVPLATILTVAVLSASSVGTRNLTSPH